LLDLREVPTGIIQADAAETQGALAVA